MRIGTVGFLPLLSALPGVARLAIASSAGTPFRKRSRRLTSATVQRVSSAHSDTVFDSPNASITALPATRPPVRLGRPAGRSTEVAFPAGVRGRVARLRLLHHKLEAEAVPVRQRPVIERLEPSPRTADGDAHATVVREGRMLRVGAPLPDSVPDRVQPAALRRVQSDRAL